MKRLFAIICLCAFLPLGCAYPQGQKLAESFLDKYKNSDYQGMYAMLHPELAAKVPYDAFVRLYSVVPETLGPMKGYKMIAAGMNANIQGTSYDFKYDVDFEKEHATCRIGVFVKGNTIYISGCRFLSEKLKQLQSTGELEKRITK